MLVAPQYEEFTYRRRVPEQELLHQVLVEHLETFLDRARTDNSELPRYVEQELRDYVDCGVLGRGFVRLKCDDCGKEKALAFSCMGRGFCPSCTGRRMADTAARLVDDVFPRGVPVRQWVLSLPIEIRYRLAYDGKLLSDVLAVFLRVVRGWYYRQAKAAGYKVVRCGSVTFAQRFGSIFELENDHPAIAPSIRQRATADNRPLCPSIRGRRPPPQQEDRLRRDDRTSQPGAPGDRASSAAWCSRQRI